MTTNADGSIIITRPMRGLMAILVGLMGCSGIGLGIAAIVGSRDTADEVAGVIIGALSLAAAVWIELRLPRVCVSVNDFGVTIYNLWSSQAIPWSAVGSISAQYCAGGEGGGAWRVVISRSDTAKSIVPAGMAFATLFNGSKAKRKAEAGAALLRSLAPRGVRIDSQPPVTPRRSIFSHGRQVR